MIEILPHKIPTNFHRLMKQKIYERFNTMKEAERETGIAHNTIANVCSGRYAPRLDTIMLLLKQMDLDMWIIDRDGNSWRIKL